MLRPDPSAPAVKNQSPRFGERYDWTTGAPHDGDRNEWKKYRVVPRAHPSRTLLYVYFNRGGSKGAFSFPGATWDCFRCTVEPSPGHSRCRQIIFPECTGMEDLECANGCGRFGGQTAGAGGHPKAFLRAPQPLFAVPALRELESACR